MGSDNPISFLKQSIRDFKTVGSLAPSSPFLARGIAKSLPPITDQHRILEVGAGTGSLSVEIARRMNGRGHLDLYELSPEFCAVLRQRLANEAHLRRMQSRVRVHQGDIRDFDKPAAYDAIVSGLPFNSFRPDEVQGFLEHFRFLLKPGGELIWFEYVAIRKIQYPFVSKARREQLKEIGAVTGSFIRAHQCRQEIIAINFPPARIRHLKFG